jgi:galactonate dehydratase
LKIARIEHLHADAGWRRACYLKITTADGTIGWSEYNIHTGTAGLVGVIDALGALVIGMNALEIERIAAFLRGRTLQASGGMNQHAIAAICNALFDIKGKALGVPVHSLLGGAFRDRLNLYWSHCGTYRVRHADVLGAAPLKTFDDIAKLGAEVKQRGYRALKTGMMDHDGSKFVNYAPAFAQTRGYPELNIDTRLLNVLKRQLAAFREGAGDDIDLLLDTNFHFKTEGFVQIARAVEPFNLLWLELDTYDPLALKTVRNAARCPIASLEALFGRRQLKPYLDIGATDVAIIDVTWNGYLEALKMAEFAETYEVNVAPHSFGGGMLGDVMSAHFAAAVPNFRIMEIDVEDVPWKPEFLTHPLVTENGDLLVPQRPGWGTDVNEDAVRAHPPK